MMPQETDPPSTGAPSARARYRGCLLGGALGDALGAGVEFLSLREIRRRHGESGVTELVPAYGRIGAITDDTQMTLFTAEGLIRAWVSCKWHGSGHPPSVVWHAYLRWLHTQGGRARSAAEEERAGGGAREAADEVQSFTERESFPDGWLVGESFLHQRRAPGNTCLSALRSGRMGSVDRAINDSKGCGGVMRAAPAGLVESDRGLVELGCGEGEVDGAFELGVDIAAITHGHPSGYLPAGVVAATVQQLVHGVPLDVALDAARALLPGRARHQETLAALDRARAVAARGPVTPERLEALGGGWVGEEAMAIAVAAALAFQDDPPRALLAAVSHSGDSDSTGSLCGQILGARWGEAVWPEAWLNALEGRESIVRLADDLHDEVHGSRPQPAEAPGEVSEGWELWRRRYPAW